VPKVFDGVAYYSLPEAAKIVGVTSETMRNWVIGRIRLNGIKLQLIYDGFKHQRFLSEDSVNELKQRFPGGKLTKHKKVRKPYKKTDRTTCCVDGTTYYSVPTAAKLVNVSRSTMHKWVTGKVELNGLKPESRKDPHSRRYYVSESSIQKLLADRFRALDVDPSQQLAAPYA
jgi:transposase